MAEANERRGVVRSAAGTTRALGAVLIALLMGCVPQTADVTRASDAPSETVSVLAAHDAERTAAPTHRPEPPALSGTVARKSALADVHRQMPAARRRLELTDTITGDISPKSVVASGDGLFLAQNMMYRHTVTAYDGAGRLLATIPDEVDLSAFGIEGYAGTHRGAPVEAAFTPSGEHAYVSNYSMYGPGFDAEGGDVCTPADSIDHSYVYRIDTTTLEVDDVIEVGAVPKYVAVSPDGRWVLVTNWCSYDLSVIDAARGEEVRRVDIGAYPRGIAVDPASSEAHVAVMGSTHIAVVDLDDFSVSTIDGVGQGPRDLRMSPDGRFLYVTLNAQGTVAKIRRPGGEVRARTIAGRAPRSLAISGDGTALYVVNYHSNTVSKIRTRDMAVVQTVETHDRPIGIAYDVTARKLWVACYSGSIMIFKDA